MKQIPLFLALIVPFILFSQRDGYEILDEINSLASVFEIAEDGVSLSQVEDEGIEIKLHESGKGSFVNLCLVEIINGSNEIIFKCNSGDKCLFIGNREERKLKLNARSQNCNKIANLFRELQETLCN